MVAQKKFKSYPVRWTGRIAAADGKVHDVTIKDISKGSVMIHHTQAITANSAVKLEIHAQCNGENYCFRIKGLVAKNDIFSQNRGAAISIMFTSINAKDAHSLSNILHVFENEQYGS